MQFKIEQIALCPRDPEQAIKLLTDMGLNDWVHDTVLALGYVAPSAGLEKPDSNLADLAFNYDGFTDKRELEVLHYRGGRNWMESVPYSVSHLGMHCSHEELEAWKRFFSERGIKIAQEVNTWSHTNPVIAGKRWYHYCIFDTRPILGVDIKFIVRRNGVVEA